MSCSNIKELDTKKDKERIEKTKEELFANIKRFSGYLNPLYQAVHHSDQSTATRLLEKWQKQLSHTPKVLSYFNEKMKIIKEDSIEIGRAWLAQLESWGLKHEDEEDILIIEDNTSNFYLLNDVYETGDKAKVLYPCWYIQVNEQKILIEKGAATLIYNDEEENSVSSLEGYNHLELSEIVQSPFKDIPQSHLEQLNRDSLKKLAVPEVLEKIAKNYYETFVEPAAGIRQAFSKLTHDGGKKAFEKYYSDYVSCPEQMMKDAPTAYEFMRDEVFFGREYNKETSPFAIFLEEKEIAKAPSIEIQASEIHDCFEKMPELQYENWKTLDIDIRLDKLNDLEKKVATIAHRSSIEVTTEVMDKKSLGYFDGSRLVLSKYVLKSSTKENYNKTLETLFHEGRHAYQNYNLFHKQVEQNHEMVKAWGVNLEKLGYKNGDHRLIFKELGYYEYFSQPVEVDARVFANKVMQKLGLKK